MAESSNEADLSYKGILSDDEFFDFIRKSCGSDKTSKQLQELYALSKGEIYDDVMLEIERLKKEGNPVCLLSNLREVDYKCLSERINLGLFDQLFLSYKLGMCKPHKDIFEYVINELGTNDFYFFDDK